MAADKWKIYHGFKEFAGDGSIDLDADAFKVSLHISTSNAATLSNDLHASITNEVTGNGYAQQTLTSVTWVRATATVTLDSADPAWTASGGSIVSRFAVIYDDTPASPLDPNVAYSLLDNTPADVTVTDGNTLTLQINASGILTVSGGDT